LPEGARVDDAVKDMLRSRIDDFCRMTPPIPPVLVRDFAMTCALQAWTAAWTAELWAFAERRARYLLYPVQR
jgi:hypothetical protein